MEQYEQDLQRFLQLRNEIEEELKKIAPNLSHLDKTSKLLASHFDVFRELAKNTREQIPAIIKQASTDLIKGSSEQLSQLLDELLKSKIKMLNDSIEKASYTLRETMGQKYRKVILFTSLGVVLSGFAGFGGGYFYATYSGYKLPSDFGNIYELGKSYKRRLLVESTVENRKKSKGL